MALTVPRPAPRIFVDYYNDSRLILVSPTLAIGSPWRPQARRRARSVQRASGFERAIRNKSNVTERIVRGREQVGARRAREMRLYLKPCK